MNVIRIAISGGPCSGKSTAIEYIKRYFEKKDIPVFVLEESARILLENGADRSNMLEFENAVFNHQLEAEEKLDELIKEADVIEQESIIAIYDRGVVDAYGYLNEADRNKLIKRTGIDLINAWCRYDAVMFLETAENYETDAERTESEEEARRISDSILSVWMGHPHLRYIKAKEQIEDKFKSLKNEIKSLYWSIELEKKFLIEYPNINDFEKYKPFKAEIEQIYLTSEQGSHRIRKRGANGSFAFFETIKYRLAGDKCVEIEKIISENEYNELKKEADPEKHPIIKDRYCFLYDGQYFEMDVYPFWDDKAVVELELTKRNQEYTLPPKIKVIKDVSKDKKYKNNYLARNI